MTHDEDMNMYSILQIFNMRKKAFWDLSRILNYIFFSFVDKYYTWVNPYGKDFMYSSMFDLCVEEK